MISSVATSNNKESVNDDLETSYLNTVTSNNPRTWNCIVLVDGMEVPFKLDTGTEVTIVTEIVGKVVSGHFILHKRYPVLTRE